MQTAIDTNKHLYIQVLFCPYGFCIFFFFLHIFSSIKGEGKGKADLYYSSSSSAKEQLYITTYEAHNTDNKSKT